MATPRDRAVRSKQFFQRNYVKAMEIITPGTYIEEDIALSGVRIGPMEELVNTHMRFVSDASVTLFVSATPNFSTIDEPSGFAQFFIPQNNLTKITPIGFEKSILNPYGKQFSDFETSADFKTWVDETFIPTTILNENNLNSSTLATSPSAVHEYLLNSLGWFYILNTSGAGGLDYSPSNYVSDRLVDTIYRGGDLDIMDGIRGLENYIWRNYNVCTLFSHLNTIPEEYVSGVADASVTYTSGVQLLERLETLVSILYSTHPIQAGDTHIEDAFANFLAADTELVDTEPIAPFYRFLKGVGFTMSNMSDKAEEVGLLYDVERTPDRRLELIADLIGWKFFGHDPSRWRLQLINALDVYKKIGTLPALQFAANSVLGQGTFEVSSQVTPLWESYIPHLAYYALATESPALSSLNTWSPEVAAEMGVNDYSTSSLDENIRICVDYILLQLVREFPDHFFIGKDRFPQDSSSFVFDYRGRNFPIPPFEQYKYYKDSKVTFLLIDRLVHILKCFGVRQAFADTVGTYIKDHTVEASADVAIGNEWLFFASSHQDPPNFAELVMHVNDDVYGSQKRRDDYLPLWNGKSSHIKVIFAASSFDFNTDNLDSSGGEALYQSSKVIHEFTPAHTIPDILALINQEDAFSLGDVLCADIVADRIDSVGPYGRGDVDGVATSGIGVGA